MKTKKIITLILTAVAGFMIIASGIMKLSMGEQVVEMLTKLGVGDYIPVLGIMEIAFAVLFIYPKTMKLGFILLTCYFAGALATELSHGGPVAGAVFLLTLTWVTAFLRDPSVFLPSPKLSAATA